MHLTIINLNDVFIRPEQSRVKKFRKVYIQHIFLIFREYVHARPGGPPSKKHARIRSMETKKASPRHHRAKDFKSVENLENILMLLTLISRFRFQSLPLPLHYSQLLA